MQGGRAAFSPPEASVSAAALLWGLVFSFAAAILVGVGIGLATALSEWDTHGLMLQGVNYGVIVLGGFYAARRAQRLGWLHGGLVGTLYFLITSFAFVPGFEPGTLLTGAGLAQTALVFAAGGLGGVVGRLF